MVRRVAGEGAAVKGRDTKCCGGVTIPPNILSLWWLTLFTPMWKRCAISAVPRLLGRIAPHLPSWPAYSGVGSRPQIAAIELSFLLLQKFDQQ
jgi:hypothetical protein